MKRNRLIILTCLIVLSIFSGCSSASSRNISYIEDYISGNTEYELDDLRVVEKENGKVAIVATLDKNTSLDEFVPQTKDIVSISNEAAAKKNIAVNYVNTIIYLKDSTYCEYIGWSSENGTLYTDKGDRIENTDIDNVDAEIEKLFKEKESANQLAKSHLNINQIKSSIKETIIAGTDLTISYVDIFEYNDWTLNINVGISGKEKNDPVITQFGAFVEQVMTAVDKSVNENETVIKLITIGISDNSDMPIVNWISENCETGLLSDYRSEKISYDNISVKDIQSYLE